MPGIQGEGSTESVQETRTGLKSRFVGAVKTSEEGIWRRGPWDEAVTDRFATVKSMNGLVAYQLMF